jgi:ABC-2 type transport system ATP-binding protein
LIKVRELSRSYSDLLAVNKVSFCIEHGEVVGLLGHNGAGKTTVMKMLTGYLAPSSGQIEIDGHQLPDAALALQSQLGYLPEVLPVYPEMSVMDYLDYIAVMRNIPSHKKPASIRAAIEETDLGPKALKPIYTLSRGYKQRVGVASAIIHSPKILILDEPTNGLDPEQTQHMRDLICRLAKNATVILSTHIMQEVEAICTRVLILQNGRLQVDESLPELRQTQQVNLATNANFEKLSAILQHSSQIEMLSENRDTEELQNFTFTIRENIPVQQAISETTRLLIQEGVEIFSITPKKRNLESIVKNLHQAGGQ